MTEVSEKNKHRIIELSRTLYDESQSFMDFQKKTDFAPKERPLFREMVESVVIDSLCEMLKSYSIKERKRVLSLMKANLQIYPNHG